MAVFVLLPNIASILSRWAGDPRPPPLTFLTSPYLYPNL
jgi:hypothetical protein